MSHSVKLSEELYTKASKYGDIAKRSVPKQIEYWAEIDNGEISKCKLLQRS